MGPPLEIRVRQKEGGIIRDSEGRWMRGFARSIGFTTSITAKFWALGDGLLQAVQIGV